MNILILEDNKYQRENIRQAIKSMKKEFNIYEAENGRQALEKIKIKDIDLFILDIELPDISGIKVAEEIRKIDRYEITHIIFITTHVYFQMDAFKKIHCYDFLEKPYKKSELIENIDRLYRGTLSLRRYKKDKPKQSVCFEMKDYFLKIYLEDILFIESQLRHIIVHTINKEYLIKNISIKKVLEKIKNKNFVQTHRSYIINMNNIKEIIKESNRAWEVRFKNYRIPAYVGRTYKNDFDDEFKNYKKIREII